MSHWQDRALCNGLAPAFDFEFDDFNADPLSLVPQAKLCARCPVKEPCKTWADGEMRTSASAELGFVAAGFAYIHRGPAGRRPILWRTCEAEGCENTLKVNGPRFCCVGCRLAKVTA